MDCVVSGPGIEPQAVVHHGYTKVSKWPSPGDTLPIVIDRKDPKHFTIKWDQLTTGHQQAMERAEAVAAQMRAGQSASGSASAATQAGAIDEQAIAQAIQQQLGVQGNVTVSHVANIEVDAPATFVAGPDTPATVSAADVLARGTPGSATLLGTFPSDQPAPQADHTMIGLMLTVMIDGNPPYQVQNLYNAPTRKLDKLAPGTLLPVKADPAQLGIVAVDWEAL
jgi:hypothetical protein